MKKYLLFFVASFLLIGSGVLAVNVSGWAWSDNVGWISFRDNSAPYGVEIDSASGDFSGYAWADNLGWISFNSAEFGVCPSGGSSDWYNPSWTKRKKITIQNANIDSDLTDFPLYVDITLDAEIGALAQADGDDVLFTADDGTTKLAHEEEYFNVSAGNATGHYWVKVPTVSSSTTTDIYVYYGNASASDQQQITDVWDSNYAGVWHLSEGSGSVMDSTSNNNDGIFNGDLPDVRVGKAYNAQDFDENGDYINCGSDNSIQAIDYTISAWIYPRSWGENSSGRIYSSRDINGGVELFVDDDANFWVNNQGASNPYLSSGMGTIALNDWHYVSATYDGLSSGKMYVNGIDETSDGGANPPTFSGDETAYIGARYDGVRDFNGMIDELRVTNDVRGVSEIKFEYYNMNEPDNELTWGGEENFVVGGSCQANMDIVTGDVSGWARACRVFQSGCSGALKDNSKRGDWDGWISLSGAGYGVSLDTTLDPNELQGWAWGGEVIGWISFYEVTVDSILNNPPFADIGNCTPASCQAYQGESLVLRNLSEDPDGEMDIVLSQWFTKLQGAGDGSYVLQYFCNVAPAVCDYSINTSLLTPTNWHTAKLYVEDAGGLSSIDTRDFYIIKDIEADFECSLDNIIWTDCSTTVPVEGNTVYFRDNSSASEGGAITSRTWSINGSPFNVGNNTSVSLLAIYPPMGVTLEALDSNGRTDSILKVVFGIIPLPSWREVSPF